MSTRKRKVNEIEEAVKPKSAPSAKTAVTPAAKKANRKLREEAKARARAWAATQSIKSPPPVAKVPTAKTENVKGPTLKRRKLNDNDDDVDEKETTTPGRSKKEQREEARARAQEWAAAQLQQPQQQQQQHNAVTPTTKKQSPRKSRPSTTPDTDSPPRRRTSERTRSPEKSSGSSTLETSSIKSAPVPYRERPPQRDDHVQDSVDQATMTRNPYSQRNTEQVRAGEAMALKEIERRIQEQVLSNVMASLKNQPLPYIESPFQFVDNQGSPIKSATPPLVASQMLAQMKPMTEETFLDYHSAGHDDDDDVHEEPLPQKRWISLGAKSLAFAILAALVAVFYASGGFGLESTAGDAQSSESALPPCFASNRYMNEDEQEIMCDKSKLELPCPEGGICSGGGLRSCMDVHQHISEAGDQCVLTATANETLAQVEELVANWTIHFMCDSQPSDNAMKMEGMIAPAFDLASIQETIDVTPATLSHSGAFEILQDEEGAVMIGLTDEYVNNRLRVPLSCGASWLLSTLRGVIWSGLTLCFSGIMRLLWSVTTSYPLHTLLGCIFLWGVQSLRKRRRQRMQLLEDVANVRQLAYERLMEDISKEHVVLHIRDELAIGMHPISKTRRAYIIHTVWPRVVVDVKQDNRVLKMNRLIQGAPRDVWQWVAVPTPNKKKHVAFGNIK